MKAVQPIIMTLFLLDHHKGIIRLNPDFFFNADRRTEDHQRFNLHVNPESMDFKPEHILIMDFNGNVLLDAGKQD